VCRYGCDMDRRAVRTAKQNSSISVQKPQSTVAVGVSGIGVAATRTARATRAVAMSFILVLWVYKWAQNECVGNESVWSLGWGGLELKKRVWCVEWRGAREGVRGTNTD
jgi:hypothetical protein